MRPHPTSVMDPKDNKTNGVYLQLEQLASTNLITVRIKWLDTKDLNILSLNNNLLLQVTNTLFVENGNIINSIYLEKYEFLDDEVRLKKIKEHHYTFESKLVELDKSIYSNGANNNKTRKRNANFRYDVVIQCQFKRRANLNNVLSQIPNLLIKNDNLIDTWSISYNLHALTHPNNLFIGNVDPRVTLNKFKSLLQDFGPIISIKLIDAKTKKNLKLDLSETDDTDIEDNHQKHTDNEFNNNTSTNFGFVSFQLGSQASDCINKLNNFKLKNFNLLVNYHVERKERERLYYDRLKFESSLSNGQSGKNDTNSYTYNINSSEHNDLTHPELDNEFKCVFIGNLPKFIIAEVDNISNIVTSKMILDLINEKIDPTKENFEILSSYFPTESISLNDSRLKNIDSYKHDGKTSHKSQHEVLKGYGFIKVATHEEAIRIIDTLHDFKWYNNNLIVNRAIQNRVTRNKYSNRNNSNHNPGVSHSNNKLNASYQKNFSPKNIPYQYNSNPVSPNFSRTPSYLDVPNYLPMHQFLVPAQPSNSSNAHDMNEKISRSSSISSSILNSNLNNFIPNTPPLLASSSGYETEILSNTSQAFPVIPPTPIMNAPQIIHSPPIANMMITSPPLATIGLNTPPNNLMVPTVNSVGPVSPQILPAFMPTNLPLPNNLPIPLSSQQESNIYVKNIPLSWDDTKLNSFYEKFGPIISAKVITADGGNQKLKNDNDTEDKPHKVNEQTMNDAESTDGNTDIVENMDNSNQSKSKGYGFVCFQNPIDASRAIMSTNGFDIDRDNVLEVSFANKKKNFSNNRTTNADSKSNRSPNYTSNKRNHKDSYFNNKNHGNNEPNFNQKFMNALLFEQNHFFIQQQQQQQQRDSLFNNFAQQCNNFDMNNINIIPQFIPCNVPVQYPFNNNGQ